MDRLIEFLNREATLLESKRKEQQRQASKLQEIRALDIPEDLKRGREMREVGDPVFYDKTLHDDIKKALPILGKSRQSGE